MCIRDRILTICFYEGEYYIGTYGGGMMVLNPETLSLKYFAQGGDGLSLIHICSTVISAKPAVGYSATSTINVKVVNEIIHITDINLTNEDLEVFVTLSLIHISGSEICLSVTIASSFNATLWGTILLLIAII